MPMCLVTGVYHGEAKLVFRLWLGYLPMYAFYQKENRVIVGEKENGCSRKRE